MRITAHQDNLFDGEREVLLRALRKVAYDFGPFARRECLYGAAFDLNEADRRLADAGDDVEERTLPSPVHARQHQELA